MARKKVKKRRSVRRKKTTRYFKEGTPYASGNKIYLPQDLGAMERRKKTFAGGVRNFTEKYLWPAYNGFLAEINNARDDPGEQRRIFADYIQLSNNDTHAKQILNHYADDAGNLDWDRFVADVSSQEHLFNPDVLSVDTKSELTQKNKIADQIPLKAQVLRRLAIRHQDPDNPETTYNLDKQIQKGASDVILPKYITDVYGTLMGNTNIAKNEVSQSKADTLIKKYMSDVYKNKYDIDKSAEKNLKRIFHGRKEKNIGEMVEWAKQNPKEFAGLIEYDKIQNPNYGYKKDSLFSKITQRPWIDPEGFDVDKKSNKYDEGLAIDINKKLGLKQGSMNPISVALAMKYNELKTEDGMDNKEIIKELMGKDLEVEYIERAKKVMGKKRVNAKPLKEKAKMLGVTIKGKLYDTNKTSSKKKTKDTKSKFSTGGGGGSGYGKAPGIKGFLSRDVAKKTSSGQTVYRKQSGVLKDMQKKIDKKVKQRIRPTPKQRKSYFEKYFGEEYPREFIEDAKRGMEKGNWFKRRLIEHEAKRMAVDEKYRAEKTAKKIEDRGISLARETRARQRAEAVQKAATSPWYAAWYRFSLITKWIIIIGISAAVLFLPIGMFHVLGWALAVGVVAVIQFIIWVFMEIWFLLAQTIVMLVSFVGQGFSFIVNWIGRGFGDLTGGEYQDTTYTDVQNMLMFDKVGDGIFAAATYEDTEGARQFLTWGALNLVPPNFLKLDNFKPESFNTNTLISYVIPPLQDFFHWVYDPIANRYTNWMVTLPPDQWYWPGVIIGVPAVLAIIGAVLAYRYLIRKKSFFV